MGKIYVEHYGNIELKNLANGEKGIIEFKRQGWFDKSFNDVTGTVFDANGVIKYTLEGK